MIIGLLENRKRELIFSDNHKKIVSEKDFNEMIIGNDVRTCIVVKTDKLTNKEFQELHFNIESKKNSLGYGLSKINSEIIKYSKRCKI